MSKFLLSVVGAFAEFERSLIRELQADGIAVAYANGVYRGRKPALTAARSYRPARASLTASPRPLRPVTVE